MLHPMHSVPPLFSFEVNNTQTIGGLFSTISGKTISVDWGDGSARSSYSGTDQAYSKDYGSAGDRTVRIFGSAALTKFTSSVYGADISFDIANLPPLLAYFYVEHYNAIASYSGKTWTTTPGTFYLSPGGLSWPEMDQLLIDFDDDLTWSPGDVIWLRGNNGCRSHASDGAVSHMEYEGAYISVNCVLS